MPKDNTGMKAGLYIVGTPIGNLDDISARALSTLRGADCVLAEDTRHTRILLDRYAIKVFLASCHMFNERARVDWVLEQIRYGKAVALVTNAGMPGVADPGALMARACREAGLYLTVIPGASSATAAIALSGFGGAGFIFEGFLPRKPGARRRRLTALQACEKPAVIMESPYRCLRLLDEIEAAVGARKIFMGRELTKINEECLWGSAAEIRLTLAGRVAGAPQRQVRGEVIFVIAGASRKEAREASGADEDAEAPAETGPGADPEQDPGAK